MKSGVVSRLCVTALVFLAMLATQPVVAASDAEVAARPSLAATQSIEFEGQRFVRKFEDTDHAVSVYEFFLPQEEPQDWTELVAFRVSQAGAGSAVEQATRTAQLFKQQYPHMQFGLLQDQSGEAAMVDFFVPGEDSQPYLEFNIFKFFSADNGQVISFQYGKKVSTDRDSEETVAQMRALRQQMMNAMAVFPVYRK